MYDITKPTSPAMPKLGKGTECIKILLSQVSKDMHQPLLPMLFPVLGAHVSGAEFQYPDLRWKEPCGMMANLVADSGCNKGQLSYLVEAICQHNVIIMDCKPREVPPPKPFNAQRYARYYEHPWLSPVSANRRPQATSIINIRNASHMPIQRFACADSTLRISRSDASHPRFLPIKRSGR